MHSLNTISKYISSMLGILVLAGAVFIPASAFAEVLTEDRMREILADPSKRYYNDAEGRIQSETLPFDPKEATASQYTKAYTAQVGSIQIINLGTADPLSVFFSITNIALSLLATGALILVLYAGFLWLTARGNAEQITHAQTLLIRGGVGFFIIFSALGISVTVFNVIDRAVNPPFTLSEASDDVRIHINQI